MPEYVRQHIENAHRQIPIGYNAAINSYITQKNSFLADIGLESEEAAKQFMEDLNQQLLQEVPGELDDTFDRSFAAIRDDVANFFASGITGDNPD